MKINKCGDLDLDNDDNFFCLLSKIGSACYGDSGGPMICEENDKVVFYGVASAVSDISGSCRENFVNIYASVYQHIELIESTLVGFFFLVVHTMFIINLKQLYFDIEKGSKVLQWHVSFNAFLPWRWLL